MRDSVGGARAQFFCSGLPDQDQPHYFSTPLYGEDTRTVYSGELMYACNHSSGGVTYLQNMSYIFDYSGGENATTDTGGDIFRLDFSTLPFPRPFPRPSLALCVPRPTLAHATLHAAGTAALRHGYRILRIEFCAQRGVGAECLPRLFACADFSMAANGCRAGLGVNINYTVMVQYPDKVWDSLQQIDKLWPRVKPAVPLLTQVMTVSNATVLDSLTPVFSVASLICPDYAKGDDAKCGAVNQNMSNMLIQTGTNVEIEVKSIEGSSQGPDGGTKDPPGLAFQLESTISFLSSQASGLCQGMKPFCCAEPSLEAGCCCTPHDMKAQCKTGMAPFTSDRCAAPTGQNDVCSDHMDDPSKPDNGKGKKIQKSDCEIFKTGVYNFTIQKGSGVQGRVSVCGAYSHNQCQDIDACYGIDCGQHGSCSRGWCVCESGAYSGTLCQNFDACYGVDCGDHGSCSDGTCTCESGAYSGAECQYYDACYGIDCGVHGTCTDGSCICENAGYAGAHCETCVGIRDETTGVCYGEHCVVSDFQKCPCMRF